IDGVGMESPDPDCPRSSARPKAPIRHEMDGNASERRKEGVQYEDDPRRCVRVDAEYPEHASEKIRVERCSPRRLAGLAEKRRTEAFASGVGAHDETFLSVQFEVV